MTPDTREVANLPIVNPDLWEEFDGFRETYLMFFTVPKHNATLRAFADVLSALIGEAERVMPKHPEGWFRTRLRAALADLRYLQGYLAQLGDDNEGSLARLARRKAVALGKIADAIECGLAEEEEV